MKLDKINETNLLLVVKANRSGPCAMERILASEKVREIFSNLPFDKQVDLLRLLIPSEQADLFELLTPEGKRDFRSLLTPVEHENFLEQFKLTDEPIGEQKTE